MGELAALLDMTTQNLHYHLRKEVLDPDFVRILKLRANIDGKNPTADTVLQVENKKENNATRTTGEEIRNRKAFEGSRKDVLKAVPIKAQAGYAQHYMEPVFIDELLAFDIPGLPYAGDKFRAFEVSGDSMEFYGEDNTPGGLREGMWVIGEKIEPEFWHQIANFYVHIVVTETRIMVKRLYRFEDAKGYYFAAVSDNPDYPQFILEPEEIRELWLVKRKIDWDMPPPRKIDINKDLKRKPD